jgi:hypothetical protein
MTEAKEIRILAKIRLVACGIQLPSLVNGYSFIASNENKEKAIVNEEYIWYIRV